MSFTKLTQQKVLKLAELYDSCIAGRYVKRTESKFSQIYWLAEKNGDVTKIYGNKSLDLFMNDSLLGRIIKISCVELKDTGKGSPFAIADVRVWEEGGDEDEEVYSSYFKIPEPQVFE